MLAEDSTAIVIDFDSCHKIEVSLKGKKAGTVDWDHGNEVSQLENDDYGLKKVLDWLKNNNALMAFNLVFLSLLWRNNPEV